MLIANLLLPLLTLSAVPQGPPKLQLHGLFADGSVLQRDKPLRIFGRAKPNHNLTVRLGPAAQTKVRVDADGKWVAKFPPQKSGARISPLVVKDLDNDEEVSAKDLLLGDVWVLGGQSNMELELHKIYDGDLEVLSAHFPNIRLMTVPKGSGPKARWDVTPLNEFNSWAKYYEQKGSWRAATPKTVRDFSAHGFVFGKRLHEVGQVPIGLIDVSRGGTCVETWTAPHTLAKIPGAAKLVEIWNRRAATFDPDVDLAQQMKNWERHAAQQRKQNKKPRAKPTLRPGPALDMNRPSNCYNGMLSPLDGLAVCGVIWNQGYNNALADARPKLYAEMFQAMIRDWRQVFRDPDLPFGIIGFSAGGQPQTDDNFEACMVDAAPFIREAQFRAAREMKNVGYVATWDQQMNWYHPFKKAQPSESLARWAITKTLGKKITWRAPALVKHEIVGSQIRLTFDRKVETHDGRPFLGFAIAGADKRFYPTTGTHRVKGKDKRGRDQLQKDQLTVSHPLVPKPVAVRYAWARNPIGNGASGERHGRNLPIPGFRTDAWDYPEAPLVDGRDPAIGKHRGMIRKLRREAQKLAPARQRAEAKLVLEASAAKKK